MKLSDEQYNQIKAEIDWESYVDLCIWSGMTKQEINSQKESFFKERNATVPEPIKNDILIPQI